MIKKIAAIILSLTMIFCMLPLTAFADGSTATTMPLITLEEEIALTVDSESREFTYAFIPEADGVYAFYSFNNVRTDDGELDTEGYIFDSSWQQLAYNNDRADGDYNFYVTLEMTAGSIYYLQAKPLYADENGSFSISVESASADEPVEEPSLVLDKASCTDYVGSYVSFTAQFLPEGAAQESITWTSSDNNIAELYHTESTLAAFYLKSAGTATITATTASKLTATATVTAMAVPPIALNESVTLTANETQNVFMHAFTPEESGYYHFYSFDNVSTNNDSLDTRCYIYNSAMEQIAENDDFDSLNFGVTVHMKAGNTYYLKSRTYNSESYGEYSVSVKIDESIIVAESISLSRESLEGYANLNDFWGIAVYFSPDDCVTENITWSVSDESIVKLAHNTNGTYAEFNLLSAGTATITATTESGLTATCPVTVYGYENLNLDTPFIHSYTESGNKIYTFTPAESGTYQITMRYNNNDSYAYVSDVYDVNNDIPKGIFVSGEYKYDENGEYLYYESIYQYKLEKDALYYIRTYYNNYESVSEYEITVTKPQAATSMSLNLISITGFEGSRHRLYSIFSPENCAYEKVTYSSSNEDVAYVFEGADGDCYVDLISQGTATITATSENKLTATCEVTVKAATELSLGLSDTYTFTYDNRDAMYKFTPEEDGVYAFAVNDQDNSNCYLYMSLKNSDGEWLINQDGTWIPASQAKLKKGETYYLNVSCEDNYENLTAEYFINITKPEPATSMTLNYESITVYENSYVNLYPSFSPDGSAFEDVEWSIDNEDIADINYYDSEHAEIYVYDKGTVTVTATSENGFTASCVIIVKSIEDAPVINENEITAIPTDTKYAYYKFVPEESGTYAFTSYGEVYTSGIIYNSDLVEIMSNEYGGEDNNFYMEYDFTAGETYYLRSLLYDNYDNAETYDILVQKLVPAKTVRIVNGTSLNTSIYQSVRLISLISPDNAIKEELYWTIDNEEVCYIESYYDDGISIYATQSGVATITVTTECGLTDSIVITVKDNTSPEYIKIYEGDSYEGVLGGYHSFGIGFYPNNMDYYENYYWTSDNPSVVRMDSNGTAYFDAVGTATITVTTESGLTASCKITVTKPENTIELNETKTVKINRSGDEVGFMFTPEKDGYYSFYSISNDDTYGYIYGETHNDDCDGNKNFKVDLYLYAGRTYQLIACYYSENKTGEFQVRLERIDVNTEIGDLDRDGSLGATDLTLMRHALLGALPLSGHTTDTYDINADNQVNIKDLVRLKKLIAGIEIDTESSNPDTDIDTDNTESSLWKTYAQSGKYMNHFTIDLTANVIACGIGDPLSEMTQEEIEMLEPTEIVTVNGAQYYFARGNAWDFTSTENNNLITISISSGETEIYNFTLERTDETTLTVVSVDTKNVSEDCQGIAVGVEFTKQ